nr:hypothetical protein Iba_chr10dCG4500 [Ipomoea batatas]
MGPSLFCAADTLAQEVGRWASPSLSPVHYAMLISTFVDAWHSPVAGDSVVVVAAELAAHETVHQILQRHLAQGSFPLEAATLLALLDILPHLIDRLLAQITRQLEAGLAIKRGPQSQWGATVIDPLLHPLARRLGCAHSLQKLIQIHTAQGFP